MEGGPKEEMLALLKDIIIEVAFELDEIYHPFGSVSYARYRQGKENSEKGNINQRIAKKWK